MRLLENNLLLLLVPVVPPGPGSEDGPRLTDPAIAGASDEPVSGEHRLPRACKLLDWTLSGNFLRLN